MALALRICAPLSMSARHPIGPGITLFPSSRRTFAKCTRGCAIRGSAEDAEETSGQGATQKTGAGSQSPSWLPMEPNKDVYAGWGPLENDYDADRLAGLLQIGAGIALALAFSLVTYTVYSRKGTKHAVVYTVTTQQHAELSPESRSDESGDGQKSFASDTSSTPSSNESLQEVHEENPQPVASASDLHQKKSASGQDSFPEVSDEENVVSTGSFSDSDVGARDDSGASDSEEVEHKAASTAEEEVQPINDGLNPAPAEKESDVLLTDDKSDGRSSAKPTPASDLAGRSPDKSDSNKSPSESKSQVNVLVKDKEQSGDSSLGSAGSIIFINGSEEPGSAVTKHDANRSAELNEETQISVSASLVVPMGAAEDVLKFVGLDASSIVDALDPTALEPGHVNKRPSVIETLSSSLGSEFSHSESVESFGVPAPSTPLAAAQATPGSIVVPATVDHEQEQALAALQALKVIEPGVEAGGICTRREYARWLIAVTSTLARNPAHKVIPAMYIDTVSELAFNDVVPGDPDFPYIQGLAEAGLIASNLSRHDADENGRSTDGAIFLPDSALSRQDLVCWKVALEGQALQPVDKEKLKAQSGFIDIDRINEDAFPFLSKDLAAGDHSIISSAFGYTRRFQPGKPVTRGQVAIALVTGESADSIAEELTRLEAEDIAEAAVVAELALEGRAQKQVDEYFKTELKLEKESRLSAEKELGVLKDELEKVLKERECERISLKSVQAAVEAERDLLYRFREDIEEQLQTLTAHKVELNIEKERLQRLRIEAEEGGQALANIKAEAEVEKKALVLARLWAEDEAKKARAHAKILEEVRKRWEGQGIEVRVDKELDDDNIPALGWHYSGPKTELNNFLQRAPVQDVLAKVGNLRSRIVERFLLLIEASRVAICSVWQTTLESVKVVGEKTANSLRAVGEKAYVAQQERSAFASQKVEEVQGAVRTSVAGFSSRVTDSTKKIADGFRGEARKLVGRFRS